MKLLSQAQTPECLLGDLVGFCVVLNLIQEGRVELSLHVQQGRGLSDLSTDCSLLFSSLLQERLS
jgi:hypothetical protein